MKSRIQKLGVIVGRKGVGKTYRTIEYILNYVQGIGGVPRKVLIFDVNDEYGEYKLERGVVYIKALAIKDIPLFSVHPKIEIRRIRPFSDSGHKMTLDEMSLVLQHIIDVFRGGLLIIEDINKYISDTMPNDLIGAICTSRHLDLDVMLQQQSIGRVHTKVWQNINFLRFHKNSDSVEKHKTKFPDKYELFTVAEKLVNSQYRNGNERFYVHIDLDEEKIIGNYTKEMFLFAIDEYVGENYASLIKPLLNRRSISGEKKVASPEQAYNEVRKRLYLDFYGN